MAIITLTTDFGLKDHYAGAVKGAILTRFPSASIVDISHMIEKFNIQDAAFILRSAYPDFPKGSVHIIGLVTESSKNNGYVALESQGHFFIGADNGIFALLFDEQPVNIVELEVPPGLGHNFPVRDIFVNAACALANGASLNSVGKPKPELLQRIPFRAASMGDNIRGSIIYVDSYDNAITNIPKQLFAEVGKNRPFLIELPKNYTIENISNSYHEVPEGEILALFNASGNLEIAIRNGKASPLLSLKLTDTITVRFA